VIKSVFVIGAAGEPKSQDAALNIAGVEKIRSKNLRLWKT